MTGDTECRVRDVRDEDSGAIIALIARVYSEYPGCILDVDREEPELRAPASRFPRFWVIDRAGEILGCVGCGLPREDRGIRIELKKLYIDRSMRGQGLGRRLIETVEAHAREVQAVEIELWSDTRFETAHAVYERMGYSRTGRERELHDISFTREFHFSKSLERR